MKNDGQPVELSAGETARAEALYAKCGDANLLGAPGAGKANEHDGEAAPELGSGFGLWNDVDFRYTIRAW